MTGPILVTGGSGLLGRATLARTASSRTTYALVRDMPARPLPADTLPIVHDLHHAANFETPNRPETVLHLAQSPRYRDFPEGALDVFEINVGATQRLLDWARRNGVKRFIYASTGGVYGDSTSAFKEDDPVGDPSKLGHYIATKRAGELVAQAYGEQMIVVILRFFFAYGPGQRRSMLIPRLLDNIVEGRPIQLEGEDGIRLNPIFADDAAAAVEAALGLESGVTVNVAGPEVLSLQEICAVIAETTGREPVFERSPDATPRHLVGDTARMARLLTPPRVPFAEGLRQVWADANAPEDQRHVP